LVFVVVHGDAVRCIRIGWVGPLLVLFVYFLSKRLISSNFYGSRDVTIRFLSSRSDSVFVIFGDHVRLKHVVRRAVAIGEVGCFFS
jgi:hypothetical protein